MPLSFLSATMLTLNPASLKGASLAVASLLVVVSAPFVIVATALVSRPGSIATPGIFIVLFASCVVI